MRRPSGTWWGRLWLACRHAAADRSKNINEKSTICKYWKIVLLSVPPSYQPIAEASADCVLSNPISIFLPVTYYRPAYPFPLGVSLSLFLLPCSNVHSCILISSFHIFLKKKIK